MTDTIDNTVVGYNFFDPDTGIARYVTVKKAPLRTAWPADNPPTRNDVLGSDMSLQYSPRIQFDVTRDESLQRAAIIQRAWAIGVDIATLVNTLPDNYITEYLNNVVYNRPLPTLDDLPIRVNNEWVVNPYVLAPAYLINYLLLSMSDALNTADILAMRQRGDALRVLANQLQFLIDRILIQFDTTDPIQAIILEGRTIVGTDNDGTVISRRTTLFVSEENYAVWVSSGGDETLLVADWGLNNREPDDSTISNRATIMAAWEKAQNPPSGS